MNQTILFIILFSLSLDSFGQRKNKLPTPGPPTELDDSIATENYKCHYKNSFSLKKRLAFYPFNKANKILVISYNDSTVIQNSTPVKLKKINYAKVKEAITLNELQIDSLTSILYNVNVKSTDYWIQIADPGRSCYNPRNSIMFLDSDNEVIDYIELCFECHRDRLSSKRIKDWNSCETKFDLLQSFFLSAGIKIGTTEQTK